MLYYLSLSAPLLLYLCLSFCPSLSDGRWQRPRLARAVEDLASDSFPHSLSLSLTLCCYRLERGHIQDEKQVSQEKCESLYAFSWYQHQLPRSPLMSPPLRSLLTLHFCILPLSPLSLWLTGFALSLSLLSRLLSLPLSLCALCLLLDCLSVCLHLCVRVLTRETESEREREGSSECVLTRAFVCALVGVCVCVPRCLLAE